MELKQDRIGYTNISTQQVFAFLYREFGEKTKKLQNKALKDMEEEVDITEASIKNRSNSSKKTKTISWSQRM